MVGGGHGRPRGGTSVDAMDLDGAGTWRSLQGKARERVNVSERWREDAEAPPRSRREG